MKQNKMEILFKAKRADNGEWVEGFYSVMKGSSSMLISRIGNPEDWQYKDVEFDMHLISNFTIPYYQGWDYRDLCNFHKVIPETVCQFTGLTDKNGNKIFRGDNLIDERSNGDFSDDVIEVSFVDGKFCYPNYGTLSDLSEVNEYSEIIGNVYDDGK